MTRKPYTTEDHDRIRWMFSKGDKTQVIAFYLGRSESSIRNKLSDMGLYRRPKTIDTEVVIEMQEALDKIVNRMIEEETEMLQRTVDAMKQAQRPWWKKLLGIN